MLTLNDVVLRVVDKVDVVNNQLSDNTKSMSMHNFLEKDVNESDKQELFGLVNNINFGLRQDSKINKNFHTLFQPITINGGEQVLGVMTDEKTMLLYFLAEMGLHVRIKNLAHLSKEEEISSCKNILNNTLLGLNNLDYFTKLQSIKQLEKDLNENLNKNDTIKTKIKI